jgi:Holliday junction DNA helicase RuvA
MIAQITGKILHASPTAVVIDVQGIGYEVHIPLSTFERLGPVQSTATLFTHLHVREDAMLLYGFATTSEREMFRLLVSVSGIGPKIALGILSGIQSGDLQQHIARGNVVALTSVPGVGRKTAERMILELRDKLGKISGPDVTSDGTGSQSEIRNEALTAMVSLGFSRAGAEGAIRGALHELSGREYSIQELLKIALRSAAKPS